MPGNDIYFFASEFLNNVQYTAAFHTHAGAHRVHVEVITFENAYRPLGWRKDGAWLRSEGLAWGTRGRAEGEIAVRVAGDRGAGSFECTATMAAPIKAIRAVVEPVPVTRVIVPEARDLDDLVPRMWDFPRFLRLGMVIFEDEAGGRARLARPSGWGLPALLRAGHSGSWPQGMILFRRAT